MEYARILLFLLSSGIRYKTPREQNRFPHLGAGLGKQIEQARASKSSCGLEAGIGGGEMSLHPHWPCEECGSPSPGVCLPECAQRTRLLYPKYHFHSQSYSFTPRDCTTHRKIMRGPLSGRLAATRAAPFKQGFLSPLLILHPSLISCSVIQS